jgi:hypothetical protein
MSNLTGQQINQTYPGLLNLQTATTGITSTYQQIQDGLGNNTNTRISTSGITSPNNMSVYNSALQADAFGPGVTAGSFNPGAGSQSNLVFGYFYDAGFHAYSSITVNVTTITSTSDVVELLFYDLQQVKDYGLFPCNQIMSGITLPVSSTGYQTVTLPSTLSFSGRGGGFYATFLKYTNTGATPSVRYGLAQFTTSNQAFTQAMGIVRNNGGTAYNIANRGQSYSGGQYYWFSNQTLPATITAADVASRFNTTVITSPFGFILNVVK